MPSSRVEAFSDGVFAIAITLLILDINVPEAKSGRLAHELLDSWPSFASYFVSFLVIGIIWVNHHAIFRYIQHVDRPVLFLNLALLLAVSFLPFPTALLARYVRADDSNAHIAAFVYALTMTFMSAVWAAFWRDITHTEAVHEGSISHEDSHLVARQGILGLVVYAGTLGLAWLSAPLTLAVFAALAIFWTFIYRPESRPSAPDPHTHHG